MPTDSAAILNALPNPVLLVAPDGRIVDANIAAESFFEISTQLLRRQPLKDLVPFGSPLLALIEQVRSSGSPVNEYRVDLGTPRIGGDRLVDLHVAPLTERPGHVVVMLQERTMADKIDRQLTHRGAARSVIGACRDARARDQEPAVRHSRRGATARAVGVVRGPHADAADLRRGRPHRRRWSTAWRCSATSGRSSASRSTSTPCSTTCKRLAQSGFARNIRFVEDYDPSLPPVLANRDQLIQVFLNLVKNAAEAIGERGSDGEIQLTTAFRPGVRLSVPGKPARVSLPLEFCVNDNGPGVPRRPAAEPVRSVRDHEANGSGPRTCTGRQDRRRPRRHHRMRIRSRGSTIFRVLMPMSVAPNGDQSNRDGVPGTLPMPHRRKMRNTMPAGTILVADDDAAIRTVLEPGAVARRL